MRRARPLLVNDPAGRANPSTSPNQLKFPYFNQFSVNSKVAIKDSLTVAPVLDSDVQFIPKPK
jgi:hypothetical protein